MPAFTATHSPLAQHPKQTAFTKASGTHVYKTAHHVALGN